MLALLAYCHFIQFVFCFYLNIKWLVNISCWNILQLATMAKIGQMGEFDGGSWEDYIERFEAFCLVNFIKPKPSKKAALITCIGTDMYTKIKAWISPSGIDDVSYEELLDKVKERMTPKRCEITERFRFYKRDQESHETVMEYYTQLQSLTKF